MEVNLQWTQDWLAGGSDWTQGLKLDFFAGGGGVSCAMEEELGSSPDFAVNHDAIAMMAHTVCHPLTQHMPEDVFKVNLLNMCKGRMVGLAWFSPDCRHFSKAKGQQPVSERVRGLAWVMVKAARVVRPLVMILENVEEFQTWGPCIVNSKGKTVPDPEREGETFKKFVATLTGLGYTVEYRVLKAADHGSGTTRERFILVARCDGREIGWPEILHAAPHSKAVREGRLQPWKTAAQLLDWSLPVTSIFARGKKGPLVEKTLIRIAKGISKCVLKGEPFLVPGQVPGLGNRDEVTAAWMMKYYGGVVGFDVGKEPLHTVTTIDHHALVQVTLTPAEFADPAKAERCWAFIAKYYSEGGQWAPVTDPMHTLVTKDRMLLVVVKSRGYAITDIGTRMLEPSELFAAHDFPADRRPVFDTNGKPLSKKKQTHLCGNSVPVKLAGAVIRAQLHRPLAAIV